MTSAAAQPNRRSAAGLKSVIQPLASAETIASLAVSVTERAIASLLRRRSSTARRPTSATFRRAARRRTTAPSVITSATA